MSDPDVDYSSDEGDHEGDLPTAPNQGGTKLRLCLELVVGIVVGPLVVQILFHSGVSMLENFSLPIMIAVPSIAYRANLKTFGISMAIGEIVGVFCSVIAMFHSL